jgi:hypothetical protein
MEVNDPVAQHVKAVSTGHLSKKAKVDSGSQLPPCSGKNITQGRFFSFSLLVSTAYNISPLNTPKIVPDISSSRPDFSPLQIIPETL